MRLAKTGSKEPGCFYGSTDIGGCRTGLKGLLKGKRQHRPDIIIRLRIFFELFYLLPLHFFKRVKIRKTRIVNEHYIKKWIVDF